MSSCRSWLRHDPRYPLLFSGLAAMKKQATIGALLTLTGCGVVDLPEPLTAPVDEYRTIFPDVRGAWGTSFILFDGTAVRIVLDITERELPTADDGGPARFYGGWRMFSTNAAVLSWAVPYVPTSADNPFPSAV